LSIKNGVDKFNPHPHPHPSPHPPPPTPHPPPSLEKICLPCMGSWLAFKWLRLSQMTESNFVSLHFIPFWLFRILSSLAAKKREGANIVYDGWAAFYLLIDLTVGPIGQKALNKVVSHTDATMTLLDATRRYQTIPDDTRRYQTLPDVIRLSNPTVFWGIILDKHRKFLDPKNSSK
jgi:hypothetical protein